MQPFGIESHLVIGEILIQATAATFDKRRKVALWATFTIYIHWVPTLFRANFVK